MACLSNSYCARVVYASVRRRHGTIKYTPHGFDNEVALQRIQTTSARIVDQRIDVIVFTHCSNLRLNYRDNTLMYDRFLDITDNDKIAIMICTKRSIKRAIFSTFPASGHASWHERWCFKNSPYFINYSSCVQIRLGLGTSCVIFC